MVIEIIRQRYKIYTTKCKKYFIKNPASIIQSGILGLRKGKNILLYYNSLLFGCFIGEELNCVDTWCD